MRKPQDDNLSLPPGGIHAIAEFSSLHIFGSVLTSNFLYLIRHFHPCRHIPASRLPQNE